MGSSYYTGRVAVITGAGSGIGRALAVRLARDGALLALLDRDGPAAATPRGSARMPGPAPGRAPWMSRTGTCAAAAVAEFGRIDLLCCAAGVIHTGTALASSWEDTTRVIRVNLPWPGSRRPGRPSGAKAGCPVAGIIERVQKAGSCA